MVNHPSISAVATGLAKLSLALHLPIKGIIRNTVFEHFCGGETAEETVKTIDKLAQFKVGAILDYSVEGEDDEPSFDKTTAEILKTFEVAKDHPSIPFCVFKVTGLGSFDLLEKVQTEVSLSADEVAAFERIKNRVDTICAKAHEFHIPLLIDDSLLLININSFKLVNSAISEGNLSILVSEKSALVRLISFVIPSGNFCTL